MEHNGEIVPIKMTSEHILEMIESLDQHEKNKLLNQITPNMTIIFDGTNLVSHDVVFQINSDYKDLSKALDKIPLKVLGKFLKVLGQYISKRSPN